MRIKALLCLAMLSGTGGMAQSSGFLLGVDYSEWLIHNILQIATDSSGALYILSYCGSPSTSTCVTKLSADGKAIVWQNTLGFSAVTMAVDPNGGVYVTPVSQPGDTSIYVAKLGAGGTGIAWQTPVGFISEAALSGWVPVLAADSQGRAYVAGSLYPPKVAFDVVRLNAAGSAVDYTAQVPGEPTSMAVDNSGAAFVAGYGFLARLAPDGSAGFYTSLPLTRDSGPEVALDANGNAVVAGIRATSGPDVGVLYRLDSTGAITASTPVRGENPFALDSAGNAYLTGISDNVFPVKNTLATCGNILPATMAVYLTVIAPDGSVLQTTYIPGGVFMTPSGPLIVSGPNSTMFVVAGAGPSFAPTQDGPFPAGQQGTGFLLRLSANSGAQTFPLACLANAASFAVGAIAPGEIVTLFGNGLGPQQGVQPQATLESPYPTQAGNVEVTFDGTPAALLWAQDAQINLVTPWSLTPGRSTEVCVTYNSVKTNCLTWPVVQAAPAVFTWDGLYAAALNQDGTLNSAGNPAAPNSIVSVWATGLGAITPAQADGTLVGLPLPTNALAVGVEAEWTTPGLWPCGCGGGTFTAAFGVTYAGPAPYLVAGESQINFQMVPHQPPGAIYLILPTATSPGFQVYVAGQ